MEDLFKISFKNRNQSVAGGFLRMFKDKLQCNFKIIVDGKEIWTHRYIMEAVSERIAAIFGSEPTFGTITSMHIHSKFDIWFDFKFISIFKVNWQCARNDIVERIMGYLYKGTIHVEERDLDDFLATSTFLNPCTNLKAFDKSSRPKLTTFIWTDFGQEILEKYQALYLHKEHFDVSIELKGKILRGHRLFLSAHSKLMAEFFDPLDFTLDVSGEKCSIIISSF